MVENGVVVGVALPALEAAGAAAAGGAAAAATAAALLAAIVAILILLTVLLVYLDQKYPRTSGIRLRHYTNAADAIFGSKLIFRTLGGTFGDGVYFGDAGSEEARGIGCPPNAVDVATRFQIPSPAAPDPSLITGWVEITITRPSLYTFGGGTNSVGQQEITISSPLLPAIHPRTGNWAKALYIGEFAPGLELTGFCF